MSVRRYDAIIIGAGFYGCELAVDLVDQGFGDILVVDREPGIMRRASYVNQARVHNGYHYPRSIPTAERARENFGRFVADYRYAVTNDTTKLYAIARGSRVNAVQFERFCDKIGAPIRVAAARLHDLFTPGLVEDSFVVHEVAFNAKLIAQRLQRSMSERGIATRFNTTARVHGLETDIISVGLRADHEEEIVEGRYLFNCTYASLDDIGIDLKSGIKRELTEIALIIPPPELDGLGVTVMDGPFFSVMPFPAECCASLSHVRYTPHESWDTKPAPDVRPQKSNFQAMLRDAARYLPCLSRARYLRSIFEIKTVLQRNEDDDGRPILFEHCEENPRVVSILGSKIDNIYDLRDATRAFQWTL